MIKYLSDLDRAGIDSFKIEGRAKSEYYTAIVTYAYRNALDEYFAAGRPDNFVPSQWILDEMEKMSHREYTTGFNFGPIEKGQVLDTGGYIRNWDVCALYKDYSNGKLTVSQRNRFYQGDVLEVVEPGKSLIKSRLKICSMLMTMNIPMLQTKQPMFIHSIAMPRFRATLFSE